MRAPHSVYSLVSSSFESLRLLGGSARERVLRGRLRAHSKSGALAKRDAGRGNGTARKMACFVQNELLCVSNILTNHCHLVVWQGGGGDPGQYIECHSALLQYITAMFSVFLLSKTGMWGSDAGSDTGSDSGH